MDGCIGAMRWNTGFSEEASHKFHICNNFCDDLFARLYKTVSSMLTGGRYTPSAPGPFLMSGGLDPTLFQVRACATYNDNTA